MSGDEIKQAQEQSALAQQVADEAAKLVSTLWRVYTPYGVVTWLQNAIAKLERDEQRGDIR